MQAHEVQLEAFSKVIKDLHMDKCFESNQIDRIKLKLVGSCRHKEDADRVENLRLKCKDLGIEKQVDFFINVPYRCGI
jgi:alpha-1,2-mannosyltransferase